jgi:hypothetical protein
LAVAIEITGQRSTCMKGRRHTPEQVVRKLREADKLLGEGFELADGSKSWRCRRRPITGGGRNTVG